MTKNGFANSIKATRSDGRFIGASLTSMVVLIFFGFAVYGLQFSGPAYLSDEIGYLSKAAAIAGRSVDHPSSWHAGYSLILAPVFFLFDDHEMAWRGVQLCNAAMLSLSFLILFHSLRKLFPTRSLRGLMLASGIATSYPSWIAMSGYAFATPAIVLFYSLAVYLYLRLADGWRYLVLCACVVGMTYWIHPTGIVSIVVFTIAVLYHCWSSRELGKVLVFVLIAFGCFLSYRYGVHPQLEVLMTANGTSTWRHYPGSAKIFEHLSSANFWWKFGDLYLSQSLAAIISSFGLLILAMSWIFPMSSRARFQGVNECHERLQRVTMLLALNIAGVLGLGAFLFSLEDQGARVDVWIYGRYVDPYLYTLLGIGLLSIDRAVKPICVVVTLGFLLSMHLLFSNEDATGNNNLVNITSFWPYAMWPQANLRTWLIVGTIGSGFFVLLARYGALFFALPLVFLSVQSATNWHQKILSSYSKADPLVYFIESAFESGTCIGYDSSREGTGLPERRNMFVFYLYEYEFRRMTFDEWVLRCDGPFLTQNAIVNDERVRAVAVNPHSGVKLLVGIDVAVRLQNSDSLQTSGIIFDPTGRSPCFGGMCLTLEAEELSRFTQIGRLDGGYLVSDGAPGFLFFGPYLSLQSGDYELSVNLRENASGVGVLDVVGQRGERVFGSLKWVGEDVEDGTLKLRFELLEPVLDIEFRLRVKDGADVSVKSLQVTPWSSVR